jgi:hypothetical protein
LDRYVGQAAEHPAACFVVASYAVLWLRNAGV